MYDIQKLNIKAWSVEDRPREKLMFKGKESLSDAELIAILIGSGNTELSAVGLSQQILNRAENNLHELGRFEIDDLVQFKGIGEAKAISIVAAMEIGRRRALTSPRETPVIETSEDAYRHIAPVIADYNYEEFWVLLLNRKLGLIKKVKISQGGVSATVVDVKIILKHALQALASNLVLVHNHPSGNLKPSQADKDVTSKVKNAAKYMDMNVVDHLIITQSGYMSFSDENLL